MSTSRDSCCLPSVKKKKHDFQVFAFVQCIIKQLLDSVFVISRIIKVSVRIISRSRKPHPIKKTVFKNCAVFGREAIVSLSPAVNSN